MRSRTATGGTTAPVGTQASGLRAGGRGKGLGMQPDTFYLWLLLALELAATWALRAWSRHHHGG